MHRPALLPLAVLGAALAGPLSAQDLIAVAWGGGVYRVDSLTGAATALGTGLFGQNGAALDAGGVYWSTHRVGPTGSWVYHLTTVDTNTGAATIVHSNMPDTRGFATGPGTALYAVRDGSPDSLITIDTVTGAVTTIGNTGRSSLQGLTFHQGTLYGWDLTAGLVTIDTTTGAATDPFPALGGPSGLQWMMSHPDGRLLVGRDDLYVVDPTTGVSTLIGNIGSFDLRGCEFAGGGYIRSFGQGCNGFSGPVVQTGTGMPQVGGSIVSTSSNHAPGALGVLVFGLSNTIYAGLNLPFDLTPVLGTNGCFLNVSIDATLVGFTSGVAPADLSYTIPLPPPAAGVLFHLQHACFEPVPGNLSWSNGLTVQVQ